MKHLSRVLTIQIIYCLQTPYKYLLGSLLWPSIITYPLSLCVHDNEQWNGNRKVAPKKLKCMLYPSGFHHHISYHLIFFIVEKYVIINGSEKRQRRVYSENCAWATGVRELIWEKQWLDCRGSFRISPVVWSLFPVG